MPNYIFELYLTDVPVIPDDADYETNVENFCETFFDSFGEEGALSFSEGEWLVTVDTYDQPSLETAITNAVTKIEHAGFGISRVVIDKDDLAKNASQFNKIQTPELIGA